MLLKERIWTPFVLGQLIYLGLLSVHLEAREDIAGHAPEVSYYILAIGIFRLTVAWLCHLLCQGCAGGGIGCLRAGSHAAHEGTRLLTRQPRRHHHRRGFEPPPPPPPSPATWAHRGVQASPAATTPRPRLQGMQFGSQRDSNASVTMQRFECCIRIGVEDRARGWSHPAQSLALLKGPPMFCGCCSVLFLAALLYGVDLLLMAALPSAQLRKPAEHLHRI